MKNTLLFLIYLIFTQLSFGQNSAEYSLLVQKADSLYKAKDYLNAANTYSSAFKALGWKAMPDHRYNAARSWALANNKDSAFFQLNHLLTKTNYINYDRMMEDSDLNSLHEDKRWKPFVKQLKENKQKLEANLDKKLIAELSVIEKDDQELRQQVKEIADKYGAESPEMRAHWQKISEKDSLNLIKLEAFLDKHGWVGPDVVGLIGNSTIFFVIQHSDLKTQQKYLPMMREAVKNKNAIPSDLAYLEDRVALREGRKQIYGSQIMLNPKTNEFCVRPLEDPDNVDKRRLEMGLELLATYIEFYHIKWDIEQYKKDLPAIEELEKQNQ